MISGVFINLDRAPERRAALEAALGAAAPPYPFTRFAAVDGQARPGRPPALGTGQYGCWLSHLAVLEQSLSAPEHLHVLEDDAVVSGAIALVPQLISLLDSDTGGDWDLLYLDATVVEAADMYRMFDWCESARRKGEVKVCKVPADFTVYGMLSYVVNGRRKARLLDILSRHLHTGKPVDNVLAGGIRNGLLKAYLTAPFLTSGNDLSLTSQISRSEENFAAWLLFRRLCYVDLSDAALPALAAKIDELTRDGGPRGKLLGALLAHRLERFPESVFDPGVDPR